MSSETVGRENVLRTRQLSTIMYFAWALLVPVCDEALDSCKLLLNDKPEAVVASENIPCQDSYHPAAGFVIDSGSADS
jgi:hypothetical protein